MFFAREIEKQKQPRPSISCQKENLKMTSTEELVEEFEMFGVELNNEDIIDKCNQCVIILLSCLIYALIENKQINPF